MSNNTQISDLDRRDRLRQYMREYRQRMKEGGKCVQCAKPVHDDTRMCEYHLNKARERNRRSYRFNSLARSQHVSAIVDLLERGGRRLVVGCEFGNDADVFCAADKAHFDDLGRYVF